MTIASVKRHQLRAEVRDILLFVRAANRLRELTTKHVLSVRLAWEEARVQPPNSGERIVTNVKVVEAPDRLVVENLERGQAGRI